MPKETRSNKHFSKEGMLSIGIVILLPVLYLMSPPFVGKVLIMQGKNTWEMDQNPPTHLPAGSLHHGE